MSGWADKLWEESDAGKTGTGKRKRPWTIHRKIRALVYAVALVLITYGVIWYLMR